MMSSVARGCSAAVRAVVMGAFALGITTASAATAEAQNRLNVTGSARLSDAPGSGGSLLFIDFLTGGSISGPPSGTVTAIETISGTFLPEVSVGTTGVIQDLTVGPAGIVGAPVSPFLTIGGYMFSITGANPGSTFGPISLVSTGPSTIGFFSIFGTVTGGDFGATMRTFDGTFSAQFTDQTPTEVFNAVNSGGTLPVSFSAEFNVADATVVPEPSTYLLFATGLVSLGSISHFRRRRKEQE